MLDKKMIEEGLVLQLDFLKLRKLYTEKNTNTDVMPVTVQDYQTKEVLIQAYVDENAFNQTLGSGIATFWSTSRNELWIKGLTSGSVLEIKDILVNCEQNSLLYLVNPRNNCGACHTKEKGGAYRKSCFYRSIIKNDNKTTLLNLSEDY